MIIVLYKKLSKKSLEIYGFGYGIFRFIIEFFRGDDRGGTGLFLTSSQLMSIILIIFVVFIILFKQKIIFKNFKPAPYTPISKNKNNVSIADEISKFNELYQQGVITLEEFNKVKEELLNKVS